MILRKIHFYEHKGEANYWEIQDVNLGQLNIIVGQNATGKTRLVNIISALAKTITKKQKTLNAHWTMEFSDSRGPASYTYELELSSGIVKKEWMQKDDLPLLQRTEKNAKIFSNTQGKLISFDPPAEELTLQVRRDKKEHPFLEELYEWASNLHSYKFSNQDPTSVIMNRPSEAGTLEDLRSVPHLLATALKNPRIEERIIADFSEIGYPIRDVSADERIVPGTGINVRLVEVQETDLNCPTGQLQMSQGMFRALSLIVIIEHILSTNEHCTVVVDDLGEGMDFERSSNLMRLLMDRVRDSRIQLIVTSNDRFSINEVDVKNLNLLERNGHIVKAFNYGNSKDSFDEFEFTGLSGFDFFSRKMYKEHRND